MKKITTQNNLIIRLFLSFTSSFLSKLLANVLMEYFQDF